MDLFIFIVLWLIMLTLWFAFLPRLDRLVSAVERLARADDIERGEHEKEKP